MVVVRRAVDCAASPSDTARAAAARTSGCRSAARCRPRGSRPSTRVHRGSAATAHSNRRTGRTDPVLDPELAEQVALGLVNRQNKRRQTPDQVSELTTNRLSVYLRCLNELDAAGTQTISSQSLAEQF